MSKKSEYLLLEFVALVVQGSHTLVLTLSYDSGGRFSPGWWIVGLSWGESGGRFMRSFLIAAAQKTSTCAAASCWVNIINYPFFTFLPGVLLDTGCQLHFIRWICANSAMATCPPLLHSAGRNPTMSIILCLYDRAALLFLYTSPFFLHFPPFYLHMAVRQLWKCFEQMVANIFYFVTSSCGGSLEGL